MVVRSGCLVVTDGGRVSVAVTLVSCNVGLGVGVAFGLMRGGFDRVMYVVSAGRVLVVCLVKYGPFGLC